ncbi:MAG: endonuclease/exonuclease/phosphatase family protein [Clostridia bacterium]|nr:endonuclease/exonuclease/phosphatase family protein [Clostridia bacterium]
MNLKLTTFNLENLFNRYAFLDAPWDERHYENYVQAVGVVSIASREGDLVSYPTTEIQRNNTANAILETEPDILAVQEVENLHTLRIFNDSYLDNYFEKMILVDGNDPRGIDVGLLVRRGFACEILNIRTHIDDGVKRRGSRKGFGYLANGAVFSRDCLEVDIRAGKRILTIMVNHFKAQDRNKTSIDRRKAQAEAALNFVQKADKEGKLPIVLGDLNVDMKHPQTPGDDSLAPLLNSGLLKDHFPEDTWTHYYVPEKKVSRLDYILTHKDLDVAGNEVFRKGLTTKCKQYQGERYPTIGQEHTEASDHCPTSVVMNI